MSRKILTFDIPKVLRVVPPRRRPNAMRTTVIRVGRFKAYQITSLYGPPMRPKWKRFIDRCCEIFFSRSGRWLL